jgi:hypothetical protein
VGKRLTLSVLCAAITQATLAGVQTLEVSPPEPPVVLRAMIEVGTTSSCDLREAPHLIEHLLLSHTRFGETPVDAILALRAKGIKLSATTHSDFTEFTLEGSALQAELMSEAMTAFLGRESLPVEGFDREKQTILSELHAGQNYRSSPTFYERYITVKAAARAPCHADIIKFVDYDYSAVQAAYERLYTPDKVHLVAQGPGQTFDLATIASAMPSHSTAALLSSQARARETTSSMDVIGIPGQVEFIIPIAGRRELPSDAADALADQIRLEVQAHLRTSYQLYTARSFVDQSLVGGWIRVEIPHVPQAKAVEMSAIAEKAALTVDLSRYHDDPIWQSFGSKLTATPTGLPVIAELEPEKVGVLERLAASIWKSICSLWS